jgi:hypothetical protein
MNRSMHSTQVDSVLPADGRRPVAPGCSIAHSHVSVAIRMIDIAGLATWVQTE